MTGKHWSMNQARWKNWNLTGKHGKFYFPRCPALFPAVSRVLIALKARLARSLRLQIAVSILLLFGTIALILTLRGGKPALAAWFDDSWAYRNAIPISSHTSAESNVYISVTIDTSTSGQFQSDCGDLRFTTTGGDILPYYISSGCATATTVIHVFFQSFPAGAQTIYYYYGNPSADNGFSGADFATEATGYVIGATGSQEKGGAPVAYWKFNEGTGTNAQDSSPNNNDGTITGATWQTEDMCVSGKCLKYNGTSDYTNVGTSSLLEPTTSLTVSTWTKRTGSLSDFSGIFSSRKDASNQGGYMLVGTSSNKVRFYLWKGSWVYAESDAALTVGQWYQLEGSWDGTTVKLYVNGTLQQTTGSANTVTYTTPTQNHYIGLYGTGAPARYWPGFIDDVKIYNYARTAAQIKADYAARGTSKGISASQGRALTTQGSALSNGLVGYWKMDDSGVDAEGETSTDSSGNANNGTLYGDNSVGDNGSGMDCTAVGKFGTGCSFDGTDDYVQITNILSSGTFTLSTWFKASALSGTQNLVSQGNSGGTFIGLHLAGTNLKGYVDATNALTNTTTLSVSTWYHATLTYDPNRSPKTILYLNGNQEATQSNNANYTGDKITVGISPTTNSLPLNGSIDDVRIYNRALSAAEIRQLANWAPGPVGYWNLDEGTGTTSVNDSSGNGYTGTMNGSMTNSDWVTGKVGKGLETDTNDYISTSLNISGYKQGSYSLWVKNLNVSDSNYGYLFQASSGSNCNLGMALIRDSQYMRYFIRSDTQTINITGSNNGLVLNQWQHVAFTWDTGSAKLYVNGVLQGTDSIVDFSDTTLGNVRFGGGYCSSANTNSEVIDDVRIYNYARTQKQIIEDMSGGAGSGSARNAVGSPVGSSVGYWKFDEGYSTIANNSGFGGSALNGTLTPGSGGTNTTAAAMWDNSGKYGKAVEFDGTDDYISIAGATSLNITGSLTLSTWVNPSTLVQASSPEIIAKSGNAYFYRMRFLNGGKVRFNAYGTSDTTLDSTATLAASTWNHVVMVYDGQNKKIYLNGKLDSSEATTGDMASEAATSLYIGSLQGTSEFFAGSIDEPKIYSYALTSDEVKTDFNHGSAMVLGALGSSTSYAPSAQNQIYCIPGDTATCSSPVGEWNFEEGSGQSANDSSGNGNTGTATGTTVVSGKVGKARSFNGSSDYIDTGTGSSLRPSNLTVEVWVKTPNAGSSYRDIVSYGYDSYWPSYGIYSLNNVVYGVVRTGTGSTQKITPNSSVNIADNNWHHIAMTFDGSNAIVFIDGTNKVTNAFSGTLPYDATKKLQVGWDTSLGYFTGQMDQVRIYNYARTAAQIAWDYNRGGPVGWWKFDECQGSTVSSSGLTGGSSLNGTITIGATGTQDSVGTCASGDSGDSWSNGATGKYNSSLNFDGTDDYVNISSANLTGSSSVTEETFSLWVKPSTTLASLQGILEDGDVLKDAIPQRTIQANASGKVRVLPCNVAWSDYTTAALSTGTWAHIVWTRSGTTNKIYINGNLDITNSITATCVLGPNAHIGVSYNAYFPGQIDDVKIFNYALTATQVKTEYNQGAAIRFGPASGSP